MIGEVRCVHPTISETTNITAYANAPLSDLLSFILIFFNTSGVPATQKHHAGQHVHVQADIYLYDGITVFHGNGKSFKSKFKSLNIVLNWRSDFRFRQSASVKVPGSQGSFGRG